MIRNIRATTIGEIVFWLILAIIASAPFWWDVFRWAGSVPIVEILATQSVWVMMGLLAIAFPFLYYLVFGVMPIASLRQRTILRRISASGSSTQPEGDRMLQEFAHETASPKQEETADSLLAGNVATSRRIANNIYKRAGVYLLVGVMIAFSGLVFFYTQTAQYASARVPMADGSVQDSTQQSAVDLLMTIAPRFGILFFIELVAFFFLKQYRSAMDEFRYYEAIKRNREETLALIRLARERSEVLPVLDLVKYSQYYSTAGKLAAGESTEILEVKKLQKGEAEIFEKIIDAITQLRK